jgi:rhodanese-related sulfurtransferase
MNEQVSLQQFHKLMVSSNTLLLDIRDLDELVTFGRISLTQQHIPLNSDDAHEQFLQLPKEKIILVYCWLGNRSQYVREYLHNQGFNRVVDLAGGIAAWSEVYDVV